MFVIGTGLYDTYQSKKIEVESLAHLLSHNASLNYSDVVAEQVNMSMKQDRVLKDISFYTADKAIVADNPQDSDWRNALFNPSMSVHTEVVRTEANNTTNTSNQHPPQYFNHSPTAIHNLPIENNATLIGHISIIVDLQQLRAQWFKQYAHILGMMLIGFLIFLAFIYWRLRVPLNALTSMGNQAKQAATKTYIDTNPLTLHEKRFAELNDMHALVMLLIKQCRLLSANYDVLKKEGSQHQRQQQSASQNSSFQSMIIHELKNSLDDISSGLKLMDSQYISNEQASAVTEIREGVTHLESTLSQIVQLNRIESGQVSISVIDLSPVQIIDSIAQKYKPQANKKGVSFVTNIRHIDTLLAGDDTKIRRIIEELVNNAVRYTESGSIHIDSKIDYFKQNVRWTVKVTDTGIGINNKHMKNVFVPFFQVSPADQSPNKGSGISLGVVYKLVQLLGGELNVSSVEDKGSTFTLVLNLRDWRLHQVFTQLAGTNILVFEQDYESLEVAALNSDSISNLEAYGASVTVVKNIDSLMEQLNNQTAQLVLISEYTSYDTVNILCQSVREQEMSQRVLLVWYQSELPEHKLAELEAVGLDYVLSPQLSYEEQANLLKQWL